MRAAQYDAYGKPAVLRESTIEVPQPEHGDVLLRVHGTSVNPIEIAVRRGRLCLVTGFRFPKGVGMDFAGEIAAVAEGADGFAVGDRVWGFLGGLPNGSSAAAAQFVLARADKISLAPASIELLDAAALPLVGATALMALRDHAHLKAGQRILIRGASGGVGSAAVQLAVAMGADVTALVSASNLQFVRELGADAALDYHTHGPDQLGEFDVILDLAGSRMRDYRALLGPHGRMVTTAIDRLPYILFSSIYGPKRVRTFAVAPTTRLLADLAGFVDRGELKPIIDAVHPLADIAAAHAALEAGGGRGKQLVRVTA